MAPVHSPCPSCNPRTLSTSLHICTRSPILNCVSGEVIGGVDGDVVVMAVLPAAPDTRVNTAGLNVHLAQIRKSMDHSPIRQSFKFENNFSVSWKELPKFSEIVKFGCKTL